MDKSPKIVKVNTFFSILAVNHLVASIPSQYDQFLPGKASFCRFSKWALMTLTQSSGKITNFVKVNTFSAVLAFKQLLASVLTQKKIRVCRKKSYFSVGQNELTLMTLSRNIGKITKVRQSQHIFGNFCLQASTCIHTYQQKVKSCGNLQIFEGDQKELTSMTRSQNDGKRSKNRQSEHVFLNFSLEPSSCIHSFPKYSILAKKSKFLTLANMNFDDFNAK